MGCGGSKDNPKNSVNTQDIKLEKKKSSTEGHPAQPQQTVVP
jgi:hypothetical protein